MKKISLILVSFLTVAALFTTSCKKDIENLDNPKQVQKSEDIMSIISSLRNANEQANQGQSNQNQTYNVISSSFCFDFVYPLSIMYNDASVQSLADDNEFLQAIAGQTNNHYIIDFVYPFDISQNGTITTINGSGDFMDAIASCHPLQNLFMSVLLNCVDYVYPVDVELSDGSVVTVNNYSEFDDLYNDFSTNIMPVDMVYPFDVIQNGNTVTVANAVDFQIMIDDCMTANGYVVGIDSNIPSDTAFVQANSDFIYPITLIYNDGSTEVINNFSEYSNALLYMTRDHYPIEFQYDIQVTSTLSGEIITVHNISELYNALNYFYTIDWSDYVHFQLPHTSEFINCFTINYPVTLVYTDGSTLTVSNDAEYDQNLNLAGNPDEFAYDFVYPISITQNGTVITLNNLQDFNAVYLNCP